MHELSIADSVLGVVLAHAGDRRVTRVEMRVGHLRQVVPSALEFAWQLVTQGTAAERAELALEQVPAAVRCRACGAESEQDAFPLACGECGSLVVDVVRGEELLVDSLDLDEAIEGVSA
jgi:hydrogenase nickel incorporation protein HypA/HybF